MRRRGFLGALFAVAALVVAREPLADRQWADVRIVPCAPLSFFLPGQILCVAASAYAGRVYVEVTDVVTEDGYFAVRPL